MFYKFWVLVYNLTYRECELFKADYVLSHLLICISMIYFYEQQGRVKTIGTVILRLNYIGYSDFLGLVNAIKKLSYNEKKLHANC